MKKRPGIPKSVREAILKEYKHRCAICGGESPQVHHIDENPENNDIENLIPLCPNHHLRDQHNPTAGFHLGVLKLFRKYKDPIILSHKFFPLYRRYKFLPDLVESRGRINIEEDCKELIGFVKVLKMGNYYSEKISKLLMSREFQLIISNLTASLLYPSSEKGSNKAIYMENVSKIVIEVEDLIVELLRYQDWEFAG